ncbi:MAG: hypothetical protein HQK63_01895 [Desulfamplus sp.]|nr:hypothetical protein [Desulfamplus sp.]
MDMNVKHRCLICRNSVSDFPENFGNNDNIDYRYNCPCCGNVALSDEAANYISTDGFISAKDKSIISICLRQQFEREKVKSKNSDSNTNNISDEKLTVESINKLIATYQPLSPLRKIENFLLIVEAKTKSPGHFTDIKIQTDYPLFYCLSSYELVSLITFLHKEELLEFKTSERIINSDESAINSSESTINSTASTDVTRIAGSSKYSSQLFGDECSVMLTTKGLQRLKELTHGDKTDLFMENAMTLAQKADEEKAAAFEMVKIANVQKVKAESELKKAVELLEKANEDKELEKQAVKDSVLEMVKSANIEKDKALEKVKKYQALIKKTTAVSEITLNRLKNEEKAKDEVLKEITKLKAEIEILKTQNRDLSSSLDSAIRAKDRAENKAKDAVKRAEEGKQKALDEALMAIEEKRTSILIAQKAKQEKQVALQEKQIALERMNAAIDSAEKEKVEKQRAIDLAIEAKKAALKENERLSSQLKAAKQVADNALLAVKKAESEKKEAETVARVALGKVMDSEYKMEKALKALHKAEEEKRDALKVAYGLF